jgi:hypothetical protein
MSVMWRAPKRRISNSNVSRAAYPEREPIVKSLPDREIGVAIVREGRIALERLEARFQRGHINESQLRELARQSKPSYYTVAARTLCERKQIYF